MTAAIIAAVIGTFTGARAALPCLAEGSVPNVSAAGPLYRFCGDHVRGRNLPLKLSVNLSNKPFGMSADEVKSAIAAAAFEWDRHWPVARTAGLGGNPAARQGDCTYPGVRAICLAGATSKGFFLGDHVNTILFGDPTWCPGGTSSATATNCVLYESVNGSNGRRIEEVDIILNANKEWAFPSEAFEKVAGEINGVYPIDQPGVPGGIFDGAWYDVQSVLTHELGHALGLEHIGDQSNPYPDHAVSEALTFRQSMYFKSFVRSTSPRTLDVGDIAGLQRVALASQQDQ